MVHSKTGISSSPATPPTSSSTRSSSAVSIATTGWSERIRLFKSWALVARLMHETHRSAGRGA